VLSYFSSTAARPRLDPGGSKRGHERHVALHRAIWRRTAGGGCHAAARRRRAAASAFPCAAPKWSLQSQCSPSAAGANSASTTAASTSRMLATRRAAIVLGCGVGAVRAEGKRSGCQIYVNIRGAAQAFNSLLTGRTRVPRGRRAGQVAPLPLLQYSRPPTAYKTSYFDTGIVAARMGPRPPDDAPGCRPTVGLRPGTAHAGRSLRLQIT
jgi:hypothetical protein